ncbi:MAG: hypothetical protein ABFQ62_04710 [Patescibacteria group bacterium]
MKKQQDPYSKEAIKIFAQFFELLAEIDKREKITDYWRNKNARHNKDQNKQDSDN